MSEWLTIEESAISAGLAAKLHHPKTIRLGFAIICYGDQTTDTNGILHKAGWVLPGGARTNNEAVATAIAARMDTGMSQSKRFR